MKKLLLVGIMAVMAVAANAADLKTNIVTAVGFGFMSNYVNTVILKSATNGLISTNLSNGTNSYQKIPVAYWVVRDVKSSGTKGGSATAGTWTQRTLNTLSTASSLAYTNAIVLGTNTIGFSPGTFLVEAEVPAWGVGPHKAMLTNLTSSVLVDYGTTAYSAGGGSDSDVTESRINVVYTNFGTNVVYLGIFHYTTSDASDTNEEFGVPASISSVNESYTVVKVTRLAN